MKARWTIAAGFGAMLAVSPALAEEPSGEGLAKAAQNPVADMISVPLQNNPNFQSGRYGSTGNVLNVQPVVPFHLTEDWNLITRPIIP